jgi:hypothetical protein
MHIRLAASTTAVAFLLAACGFSSDDTGDSSGSHSGGSSPMNGGAGTSPSAGGTGGSTATGGTNATSGGSGTLGSGGTNTTAGAGNANTGSGGTAGKSGMDSGSGGAPNGAGGIGPVASGGASPMGAGGMPCGSGAGCSSSGAGRGGRPGRSMGGAGAGGASTAGTTGSAGAPTGVAGGGACPANGHVSYTLTKAANPTSDQQAAYDLIVPAMDKAVQYYNCYTNITKADTVTYDSSVQTADGNINGSIRFGGKDYMEYITAMHEISHTVGIGTAPAWPSLVVNGIFTGEHATAQLRAITGNATDQLNADTQHFWPYGLNYTSEVKSEADVINHCFMVAAIRLDEGFNP